MAKSGSKRSYPTPPKTPRKKVKTSYGKPNNGTFNQAVKDNLRNIIDTGVAVAVNRPWSSTGTKTKTYTKTIVQKFATPGAKRKLKQTLRMGGKSRPLKKGGANVEYDHHYTQIIRNVPGRQGVNIINYVMHNLFSDASTGVARTDQTQYGTNLFALTPLYKNYNTLYPVDGDIGANNDMFYLKNVFSSLNLSNNSELAMEVFVYWMAPVKDQSKNVLLAWQECIVDMYNGQATAGHLTTTAGVPAAGAIASVDYDIIGQTPLEHKNFKKMWTCKRLNKITLKAGDNVDLYTNIIYNKIIRKQKQSDTGSDFITGQTLSPLIIYRTSPIVLQSVADTTVKEMAYGTGMLGIMHHQEIKMQTMEAVRIQTKRMYDGTLSNWTPVQFTEQQIDADGDANPAITL